MLHNNVLDVLWDACEQTTSAVIFYELCLWKKIKYNQFNSNKERNKIIKTENRQWIDWFWETIEIINDSKESVLMKVCLWLNILI